MNRRVFKFILGVALCIAAITANAQKNHTEGTIVYTSTSAMESNEYKISFKGDTNMVVLQEGPALVKRISTANWGYYAILIDVPAAEWKRAAILSPDEINQVKTEQIKYTFTPTTETKQIANYKCRKIIATDKDGNNTFIWITNDIAVPVNSFNSPFAGAGGFPVQFSTILQGQKLDVVLKDVSDGKLLAGIFKIPAGYDRVTYAEIK